MDRRFNIVLSCLIKKIVTFQIIYEKFQPEYEIFADHLKLLIKDFCLNLVEVKRLSSLTIDKCYVDFGDYYELDDEPPQKKHVLKKLLKMKIKIMN